MWAGFASWVSMIWSDGVRCPMALNVFLILLLCSLKELLDRNPFSNLYYSRYPLPKLSFILFYSIVFLLVSLVTLIMYNLIWRWLCFNGKLRAC